jgi:hypothetical protein
VVIRKGDVVVYDAGNKDGNVSCQKLFIDPKGSLTFKTGAGTQVLCLGDAVESYGPIKLDGTKSANDHLEIRFVGDTHTKRVVKLLKGGALVAWGKADLPAGRRNVAFVSPRGGEKKEDIPALIDAVAGVMIDLQRSSFDNVQVNPKEIDNTDAKPNEKVNIVGNRFVARGQNFHPGGIVYALTCDTPLIANNTFEYIGDKPKQDLVAVRVHSSPLAEVRGNTILGGFQYGFAIGHEDTGTLTGNTVEKCLIGVHFGFGGNNIVKGTTIRQCDVGFDLDSTATLVAEENTVLACKTAVKTKNTTAQLTSLHVQELPKDGVALQIIIGGAVSLLNCNITADQIKTEMLAGKGEQPLVTSMHYLIVKVKDAPDKAVVDVRTAKPAVPPKPGAADLNVSNAPAELFEGMTPLPQTLAPIIVKSWTIGLDGKPVPAPEYTLNVVAPGAERKVLKSMTVQPQDKWFRAKPNDPAPTLEVSLK